MQNQYSAEFGNGTGGQFNTVIRGGTNSIHGPLYEYFQNRNLNAVDESFARQGIRSNPRYDQNTLGGAIGGPIKKNKLFYYGLFQYNPLGKAGFALERHPGAHRGGLPDARQPCPGLSQTNFSILKQYLAPAPTASDTTTVAGVNIPIGILPIIKPSFTNIYTWLVSIDYNISANDQLRGRYVDERTDGLQRHHAARPAGLLPGPHHHPEAGHHLRVPQLLAASDQRAAARLQPLQRRHSRRQLPVPRPGRVPEHHHRERPEPAARPVRQRAAVTSTTPTRWSTTSVGRTGRHTAKFGVDFRRYISPQRFIQRERGDYNYSTLERFLLDLNPDVQAERNVGGTPYWGNQSNFSWFAQDDVRVRPNLTLNLGIRYEYKGVPAGDKLQSAQRHFERAGADRVPRAEGAEEPTSPRASASPTRRARAAAPRSAPASAWPTTSTSTTSARSPSRRS